MNNVLTGFKSIRCFIFDMDGVLTDGSLLVMPGGVWVRRMNIKDGYALQLAVKKGYTVAVISGSYSEEVKDRLARLGIDCVYMNVKDKQGVVTEFMSSFKFSPNQVLCMGDDIPDLGLLAPAGLKTCPADAVAEIREYCHYISPLPGGHGCARDVIEKVLKLNGDWTNDTSVPSK